jgi:hypothetical protein
VLEIFVLEIFVLGMFVLAFRLHDFRLHAGGGGGREVHTASVCGHTYHACYAPRGQIPRVYAVYARGGACARYARGVAAWR